MIARLPARDWARSNWFLLLLPVLLAISLGFARSEPRQATEAVLLFDWCITVPALFVLCYRSALPAGKLLLRALALCCLGVLIVSWLVPAEAQRLVPRLSWARAAGIVLLAVLELRLLLAAVRIAFSARGSAAEIEKATGAPPLIARLMLMEARFWRAVWRVIKGR